MHRTPRRTAWLVGLGLTLSLSTAAGAEPFDRATGDLAIQARATLRKYCARCHDGDPARPDAPRLLDHDRLIGAARKLPFVDTANVGRSQLLEVLEDGSMPPGGPGSDRPSAAEVAGLRAWVVAKAPRFPVRFDEAFVGAAIRADLAARPDEPSRAAAKYLSFAHLLVDGQAPPDLTARTAELVAGLRHAAGPAKPGLTPLTPVEATATVFRLDTRPLGWDDKERLVKLDANQKPVGTADLTAYDLILMEYPRGQPRPEAQGAAGEAVRADWLAEALKPGRPLAADLIELARLADDKGATIPKLPPPFTNPALAAPGDGARLPSPQAIYYGDVAPDAAGLTVKAGLVDLDGKPLATVPQDTPFRIRVTASRDARFALLLVDRDGQMFLQPDYKPVDGQQLLGNALPGGRPAELAPATTQQIQFSGPGKDLKTVTEYFVLLATAKEFDAPGVTLVRSNHLGEPRVGRFVLTPTPAVRPDRVVRVVIPVTVTH